jgi:hypothetical protein
MATTGCVISHKHTKHRDKCSNNNKTKTTQKQYDKTRQILFQNTVMVTQKIVQIL